MKTNIKREKKVRVIKDSEVAFVVYLWVYDDVANKRVMPLFVQFPYWDLTKEEEDVRVIMKAKRIKCRLLIDRKHLVNVILNLN